MANDEQAGSERGAAPQGGEHPSGPEGAPPVAPQMILVPAPPLVSWQAVLAWILAPVALVPLLGAPVAVALVVVGLLLVLRPRFRWDKKVGVAATALGAVGVVGFCVALVSMVTQGGDPGFPESIEADIPMPTRVLQIAALVISVIFHECGHALAAAWAGDLTAVRRKRLTLNPLPHIDLVGSVILPAILVFSGSSSVFGWAKPVPVVPPLFRKRKLGNIGVSLAGVGVNLLLAMLALTLLIVLGAGLRALAPEVQTDGFWMPVVPARISGVPGGVVLGLCVDFLKACVLINLVLMVFNLLPVPPLDGSHVLETLLPARLAKLWARVRAAGFIILVVLIFTGAVGFVLDGVAIAAVLLCYVAGAICNLG